MLVHQCRILNYPKSYNGESCRRVHKRGDEHLEASEKNSDVSILYNHILKQHKEEEQSVKFKMKIDVRSKSVLIEIIDEGVRIHSKDPKSLLRSKS